TTEKIARELANLGGIEVSANTVGRILKELGYSLRVNHKNISSGTGPDRDAQFKQISATRHCFSARGLPMISVDTNYARVGIMHGSVVWLPKGEAPRALHLTIWSSHLAQAFAGQSCIIKVPQGTQECLLWAESVAA
ncbi:MAG: hypothetical protein GY892_15560, partial [Shimia sp.]|nr:hypothetical protein [Shimia sp.]